VADTFKLNGIALSGPTQKVALTLALAGQKFSYKHVNLMKGEHKTPEYLKLNRYGQVPVLQHGATTLCQSGAIMFYLADVLPKIGGKDAATKARSREWVFWDMDALSPPIFRARAIAKGFMKVDAPVNEFFQKGAGAALKALDGFLANSPYLTGSEPTIADTSCSIPCFMAGEANIDLSDRPNVQAWLKRIQGLPGYKPLYEMLPMNDMP
jgi:glutathione S-transferase